MLIRDAKGTEAFAAVLQWEKTKDWLSDSLHLSHAMLHVHVGMALFVLSILALRKPIGSWTPFLIVAGLELLNEASDFTRYYVSGWPWKPNATVADIVDTLLWPLILTLIFRHRLLAGMRTAEPVVEQLEESGTPAPAATLVP